MLFVMCNTIVREWQSIVRFYDWKNKISNDFFVTILALLNE